MEKGNRLVWRARLGRLLRRWGKVLDPAPEPLPPAARVFPSPRPPRTQQVSPAAPSTRLPGLRPPLSVEQAVRSRELTVLRREAGDALAALAAAHALVASARFTQLQELRQQVERQRAPGEDLATLAADYLGWQSDQVRLFDALSLVLAMRVPPAPALELIDPAVREAAESHLASLTVEYQRRLLDHQLGGESSEEEENG